MNPKQLVKSAMIAKIEASAQQGVLETIIADFFRVYLGTEDATLEDVRAALGEISVKLLAMQAEALEKVKRADVALGDIQRAMMKAQADESPPEIAAVD